MMSSTRLSQPLTRPLWPDSSVPLAQGAAPADTPTLTVYPADPARASGAAFVICPGGGYAELAEHEGAGYARWLARQGIAGLVLKYRLSPRYHHPAMLFDVARAMRLARANAVDWKIDPRKLGVMGSSAGGHLASTLLTHFDGGNAQAADAVERQSCRPDLGVLCYPVITMGPGTHEGSRENLLGKHPAPDLIADLSNEKHVTGETPPCFIWHTYEDEAVPLVNPLAFASALSAANVPFDLHVYEKGVHGLGLGKGLPPGQYLRWTADLLGWLGERGWLKPAAE